MAGRKPMVLVLCTGNSCRSQMAEGFLRRHAGDRYDVRSAGTDPAAAVHPLAVRVMAEVGIDIRHQRPKPLTDFLGREAVRHVLVVCDAANGTCPRIWPGAYTREYLPFEDPAAFEGGEAETLAKFRAVRDQVGVAMRDWVPAAVAAGRA
jgi:arsenate reductase